MGRGMLVNAFVDAVVSVLEPYVGQTVADTCVRATALSLGKTSDSIGLEDFSPLEASVRRLLAPIALWQRSRASLPR
jgi:hypothetical protein